MPSSPRRNRVTPFGAIEESHARGAMMGNRGILHDDTGQMGRAQWKSPAWLACRLDMPGRRRPIASPGAYTVLFFADEAVALAAGHRPCFECRRGAFNAYRDSWRRAVDMPATERLRAADMDRALHRARLSNGGKRTSAALLRDLPDGVFVTLPDAPERPMLLWDDALHPWSHEGYGPAAPQTGGLVTVLTPLPTVAALRAGYRPVVSIGC